jgi:2-dehydro-3-deoxy-D-arabinonate dehydratase
MSTRGLWRVSVDGEVGLARGPFDAGPVEMLAATDLDAILAGEHDGGIVGALTGPGRGEVPASARVLAPIQSQDVWAAGVTYERSLAARNQEAGSPDYYDRVYEADRPELFFKSAGPAVRGPGEPIGIRADSTWDVPEPELGLVLDRSGAVVAYVVGNDVSSRSIEGENPLYLPQAKVYQGSCALGPCLVPVFDAPAVEELRIRLTISRDGRPIFSDSAPAAALRRKPQELADWLLRCQEFPVGVVLLTGTAIIPQADFTLAEGDTVNISISGLGELVNHVQVVGGDHQ